MNALDEGVLRMLERAHRARRRRGFVALVISNDSENFSVGANIGVALFAANVALWPAIEMSVAQGQETFQRDEAAPVPGGRRAGRHGARRRLRDPAALRRGAGARRDLHGPGRGRGRRDPGWGGCKEMLPAG
jgi:3-hydroxyacyl-CoA dehydrogenase